MATKEENNDKDAHTRSLSPGVKSTAVVKYTSVQCPVEFAKLQCNTDLKMPPSNWLSSAADSYGLRHALSQSAGFSSFRMAHMFPDCVGEVDVVSGAECIKTLLKLPYHPNGTISMIVHRVENTLLLDDFDIYRYLMKTEWSWMKGFFYDNVLKSLRGKDKIMHVQNRSRNALQQKSLVSKFLYHSLIQSSQDIDLETQNELPSLPSAGPNLPDPDMKENIPDPNHSNHTYNRNVVWTFEDIQMLIGSDMPIFGGEDRPCVSLRLRDASQPINVLTGIDYWLDNLMCNVPEVVMCYHLDGIVQKYEPIKTEDLPHLEDSKFSPKVIRNVAQNILSFLKSNATKAGHTYWLFKGTHDDVVKLYDLSTLCGTASENASDQNPFTVPVAMLLYRVARNMKPPCQAGHIRLLLENCIKLLPIERYPQIVASSHYMLADLYLPAETDPGNPNFKETSVECECGDAATCRRREVDDDENSATISYGEKAARDRNEDLQGHFIREDGKDPQMTGDTDSGDYLNMDNQEISERVAVDSLMAPRPPLPSPKSTPPAVHGPVEERCLFALEHVKQGLEALKLFPDYSNEDASDDKNQYETENQQEEILKEEENPKMARPFQPIPMNYEPLNAQEEQFKMAKPNVPIPLSYRHQDEKTKTQNIEKNTSVEKQQDRSSRRRKKEMKGKKKHLSESEIDSSNNKVLKRDIENLIKKTANVVLRKESNLPTWQEPNRSDDISWKIHLKTLLYEKACLSYATLSEQHYMDCQYGMSFKYIILAQKFQVVLSKTLHNSRAVDDSCLLGRAGDNFFQFAKNWDKYETLYSKQIEARSDEEKWIMDEVSKDLELYWAKNKRLSSVTVSDITPPIDLETSMIASCEFYNQALKVVPNDRREELMRRIASVKNELGVKYMYSAQEQYTLYCNEAEKNKTDHNKNEEQEDPLYETYSKKSIACLTESAKIFEDVKDAPNLALLHCNTGRFLRFRAHCNKSNNSPEQRHLYSLAVELYGKALRLLIGLKCDSVRDLVKWELSSALFTQACLLQDFPPDNCDAASEAINALCLALRNCPLTGGPRHCLYQFRAAVLHHRLASLYHSQYRETSSDVSRKKSTVAMSKINYEQAVKHLLPLEDTNMFLTVQMEHVALLEYQANNSPGLKLKCLQNALELLQQCEPIIKLVSEKDTNSVGNSILSESNGGSTSGDSLNKTEFTKDLNNAESNERIQKDPDRNGKEIKKQNDSDEDSEIMESEYKLLSLFQQRLQFILKSLIQLCLQKQSGMSKKDCDKMSAFYKVLYSYTLKVGKFKSNECKIFARHLMDVLINMKKYSNSNNAQIF